MLIKIVIFPGRNPGFWCVEKQRWQPTSLFEKYEKYDKKEKKKIHSNIGK